jgi:NIMA (never in mitosis gene a)-related kinase
MLVFLDAANTVKLGDFGLSKAPAQASFTNTYVGTPYYMSPELVQEKAYDSKSDIWSLGCLIYALKPPFHEAKTPAELSIFIRYLLFINILLSGLPLLTHTANHYQE